MESEAEADAEAVGEADTEADGDASLLFDLVQAVKARLAARIALATVSVLLLNDVSPLMALVKCTT
jgi:hypothetical protein